MKFKTELFTKELVMFLVVQLWGIFVAVQILRNAASYGLPDQSLEFTWSSLLVLIVVGVLFFLVVRYGRHFGSYLLRIALALAIFGGSQIALVSITNIVWADILSLLLVILFFSFNKVFIQNIAVILALVGVGTILGLSLSPLTVVIVLVVMSFYDIWSVYITKHMIALANGMIQAGAIFGFVIPIANRDFFTNTKDMTPGQRSMILGSGDVVFPLVLAASVARTSLAGAIVVAMFSSVGLWFTHLLFVNQPERKAMAALPPIAMMSILGYLVFLLI